MIPVPGNSTPDPAEAGRAALARGAWEEARTHLQAALARGEDGAILEGLGLAAWWLDDAALTFDARERAYRAYRERGDPRGAARVAIWLVWDYLAFRGEFAVASGWLERARRLLEGSERTPEYGWLLVREAEVALFRQHDTEVARASALRAAELGRSLGDLGVEITGLALEGLALVSAGQVPDGMRRLDEATAAATGGEVKELHAVGLVCCWQIFACERVRDYDRAVQWCDRVKEFAKRWRNVPLSAVCRTQYAGVLMWRGAWAEAEAELARAAGDLAGTKPAMVGQALARLGELRLRQGRLEDAERLFERVGAHPLALLGRAALLWERDDAAGAALELERFLRQARPEDRTARVPGLEVAARVYTKLGDHATAAAHLAELEQTAAAVATEPYQAAVRAAQGFVAAAQGEHAVARQRFEEAVDLYQRTGAPFEAARARLDLARQLAQLRQRESGLREALAATRTLSQLGASRLVQQGEALIRELESPPAPAPSGGPLTGRQLEVLRLVAQGLSNGEIAGRLGVSEHTVKRHIANLLTRLGLSSRAAAAAQAAKLGLL